jgi:hypothetical protein
MIEIKSILPGKSVIIQEIFPADASHVVRGPPPYLALPVPGGILTGFRYEPIIVPREVPS